MKKTLIIITIIILLIMVGILIWKVVDLEKKIDNNFNSSNINYIYHNENYKNNENTNIVEQNTVQTNNINNTNTNQNVNYRGEWYLSRQAYTNNEMIDEVLDRREDRLISDEEFNGMMQSKTNSEVPVLDIDNYTDKLVVFDFELTSPAPIQREAKIENVVVNLENNEGNFTYVDNWGTKGEGSIKLENNNIKLELKTTETASGALWGVEGSYLFTFKVHD